MSKGGDIRDLDVTVVGPHTLRLDFLASVPPDHAHNDRYTSVIDIDTARAMAILLIRAIEKAELEDARASKGRKKK